MSVAWTPHTFFTNPSNHPLKEMMINGLTTPIKFKVLMTIISVIHTWMVLIGQSSVVCIISSLRTYKTNSDTKKLIKLAI